MQRNGIDVDQPGLSSRSQYSHVRGHPAEGEGSSLCGPRRGRNVPSTRERGVNECQAGNSPPDTGGVAAPSRKRREATAAAQTGWLGLTNCFGMHSLGEVPFRTTPSAPLKEASRLLLDVASTPPVSGGEWRARQFIHTFYDRAFFP